MSFSALSGMRGNSTIDSQIRDLNSRIESITEGDQPVFLDNVLELQGRYLAIMQEFQKQVEVVSKDDWDFDHYLEEDVPAAVR